MSDDAAYNDIDARIEAQLATSETDSLNGYDGLDDVPHPADSYDTAQHSQHTAIEYIDWSTIDEPEDEIVPGLIIPGRWTSIAAPAKSGKTTLMLGISIEISEGRDPFDGHEIDPVTVLYVDAEMGRIDLKERINALGLDPAKLSRWHATDMPPKIDTIEGGNALQADAKRLGAAVVVIDGINGTVTGAEKDDTTWRAFFEHGIQPLKRAGIAVITGDNTGKEVALGPRGSSVKMDKADAILCLSRTDNGIKLETTHRRTAAYPLQASLAIDGVDGDKPITYRHTMTAWPDGTTQLVEQMDRLGVDPKLGRGKARIALAEAGIKTRDTTLAAALRYRRLHPSVIALDMGEGKQ